MDHCHQHCLPCRLVKAGLLDKKYAKRFSTISAWAELVGYVGNVTLNGLRIAAALERELMLTQELVRRKKVNKLAAGGCMLSHIAVCRVAPQLQSCGKHANSILLFFVAGKSTDNFNGNMSIPSCLARIPHVFVWHLAQCNATDRAQMQLSCCCRILCLAQSVPGNGLLQEDDTMPDDVHLIREVQALRSRRLLRTLAVVQDVSDALMAINDVTGDCAVQTYRAISADQCSLGSMSPIQSSTESYRDVNMRYSMTLQPHASWKQ